MFEEYRSIFQQRGEWYHAAMCSVPDARRQEFETMMEMADLQPGQVVIDVPSGGGYLSQFLDIPVQLVCVETSEVFLQKATTTQPNRTILCDKTSAIDFPAATADRVVSLAGLHHEADQIGFYREAQRLLKPGGRLCVADVRSGSPIDQFLDVFVNNHNSGGHEGIFLHAETGQQIASAGFEILAAQPRTYEWIFRDTAQMAAYCQQLFGLDRATPAQIVDGIGHYLGFTDDGQCCRMNWELYFLVACKPALALSQYQSAA